jgi:Flp pilus assembly CpaF family ATPase
MNSDRITYFQEKETFKGEKEKILVFECNKCFESKQDFYNNEKCINCFLKNLFLNRNKNFKQILIENIEKTISKSQIQTILIYFRNLDKIKKFLKSISYYYQKKCPYKEFNCGYFSNLKNLLVLRENQIYNPIYLYNIILNLVKKKDNKLDIGEPRCKICYNQITNSLKDLFNLLDDLKIILDYKKFQNISKSSHYFSNFYKKLLFKINCILEDNSDLNKLKSNYGAEHINSYYIGEGKLYQINIFKINNEYENKYEINSPFKSKQDDAYIEKIIKDVENNLDNLEINHILPLEQLIEIYREKALSYLESKYNFFFKEKVAFFAALKKINLKKIFPLLIDDNIEEIFLDSPEESIYLNHQKFGRCRTDIRFSKKEINRLKTFLRIYSGKRLDYVNPSIKLVIKNTYFHCRFSIDVEPIHLHNFALDIRKLNKNILNIQDLLINATLNPKMAAFLYFNLLRRKNITVTGETDTGKTTLINALDLLIPKEFRKIYIENVIESLNQIKFSRHQLKYKVDSLEESLKSKFSKQNQIKKLLHRTPDLIYLGEILTKEEAEAMFHCLSAGLRGFQTIHSKNINSLINRFLFHFKIHPSCLHDLDLIILMKKNRDKRRIISISEINENFKPYKKLFKDIFKYNPELNDWYSINDLYSSNTVLQIKEYENINKEKFSAYINLYEDIFYFLKRSKKIPNFDLIKLFDEISFYSFISIIKLNRFWESWKKDWRLNL